ncbi:hypothetical protein MXB02_17385 [Pseudomonas mosselii]|uniref:hypothetical protein n=1 Tax=Pseudomonas mosselii TaxID=78327 RepID=UPI001FF74DA2|nr:hypothetical protein [Pseudomonas mosselii]UPF02350.1 hypothetical protein MXB02_17385 [Pseudomonas mosselii]
MLAIKECAGGRLGVLISGSVDQRHVGFHIIDGGDPELIHLGWHYDLRNQSSAEYIKDNGRFKAYECSNFLDEQVEEIISFLKVIWNRNKSLVPYGIGSEGLANFFDVDGKVASHSPGNGLTCATFLMSVFAAQRYPIIDEQSWQSREGDKDWQELVLGYLSRRAELADHVAEQRKVVGQAYRYRPEEVASSAAIYDEDPIVFEEAVQNGEQLLAMLKADGTLR